MDTSNLKRKITALLEETEEERFKVRRLHPPKPEEKLVQPSNPMDTHESVRALQDLEGRLRAEKGQPVGTLVRYLNPIADPTTMVRAIDLIYKNHFGRHSGETGGVQKTTDLIKQMFEEIVKSGDLNVVWRKAVQVWHQKRDPAPGPKFGPAGDY